MSPELPAATVVPLSSRSPLVSRDALPPVKGPFTIRVPPERVAVPLESMPSPFAFTVTVPPVMLMVASTTSKVLPPPPMPPPAPPPAGGWPMVPEGA